MCPKRRKCVLLLLLLLKRVVGIIDTKREKNVSQEAYLSVFSSLLSSPSRRVLLFGSFALVFFFSFSDFFFFF